MYMGIYIYYIHVYVYIIIYVFIHICIYIHTHLLTCDVHILCIHTCIYIYLHIYGAFSFVCRRVAMFFCIIDAFLMAETNFAVWQYETQQRFCLCHCFRRRSSLRNMKDNGTVPLGWLGWWQRSRSWSRSWSWQLYPRINYPSKVLTYIYIQI